MSASAEHIDEPLLRVDTGGLATLTLNRPAQYNALSEALLDHLQHELDLIRNDESINAVVLAASGKAFCAGHDLKEMRQTSEQAYYQDLFTKCSTMMQSINTIPQPVIAKVQGMATAAGCQLVAACDLAIASEQATFAVSGVNLGLFCSTPSVALSRNVPRKKAFEMLVTGEFIDADQAAERGLINAAVPAAALDEKVATLVSTILAKPAVAIRTGKQMFYKQLELGLSQAYEFAGQTMSCNMMDADTIEGIDAFIEKRPPNWKE